MLTDMQLRTFRFIEARIESTGVAPTYAELADGLRISTKSGVNRLVFATSLVFVAVMILGTFGDLFFRLNTLLPNGGPLPENMQGAHGDPATRPGAMPHGPTPPAGH